VHSTANPKIKGSYPTPGEKKSLVCKIIGSMSVRADELKSRKEAKNSLHFSEKKSESFFCRHQSADIVHTDSRPRMKPVLKTFDTAFVPKGRIFSHVRPFYE
jgi:hypothetical protein